MTNAVGFLTTDWAIGTKPLEPNGCAWYRCLLPMNELIKQGWESKIGLPFYNEEHGFGAYDLETEEVTLGWKIVVLKLVMHRDILEALEVNSKNQIVVVDVDDWYEGLQESNYAHKTTDPSVHPDNNREIYLQIIDKADYITVSTQFLYDYYTKEKGKTNVFLVRNGIDVDRWRKRNDHARNMPTVGWVGAIPWRSNDLETLTPFFGEFMGKHRLPFHHSGHIKGIDSSAQKLGLPDTVKFTHESRKPITQYPSLFRKIDIGIVPLNDIPFNYAKSTIKGLEYAASGVPFIASYSPEYSLLEMQGVGRVARTPEEWIEHLEELLDPKVRKEDAEKNYENLLATQTMEVRGESWNKVFNTILERGKP